MSESISFTSKVILAEGTNSDIDTAEEDIVVITSLDKLNNTQLSIYIDTTFGTHTSMEYRFYQLNEVGGTWYPRVKINSSDNTLDDYPGIVDSSTPNSGVIMYEQPLPSCFGFKVTGKGVGGANGAATVKILARDN